MQTQVLIIGAGITGAGVARDLALRGVHCIIVEKQDVNAGASGGNHGLLHSGARYIASDPASAVECQRENHLLKHLAAHCIEATGGLFVAVAGDDENYIADFSSTSRRYGITASTRVSSAIYTDEQDVEQFLAALAEVRAFFGVAA